MPTCSAVDRFAMRLRPEAAAMTCNPCAPVTIASSSRHSPPTTWPRLKRGVRPSITSTFASPRSASSSSTSRPRIASATPRLMATVVLPMPPLPPVTATTLTGVARFSASSAPAWVHAVSPLFIFLCIHRNLAEMFREHRLVGYAPRPFAQLRRRAHEPHAARDARVDVFGHALPVRQVRDRQVVPNDGRQHRAETPRLVDFGEHTGFGLERGENADGVIERRELRVRRAREQDADAVAVARERLQLLREFQVEAAHARRIDEHELARRQGIEDVAEFTRIGRDVHRHADDASKRDRKSTRLNSSHTVISYAV